MAQGRSSVKVTWTWLSHPSSTAGPGCCAGALGTQGSAVESLKDTIALCVVSHQVMST